MSEIKVIHDEITGEKYNYIKHSSGLDILVWEMEGFSSTEALFGTKYGSINTMFKTEDDENYTAVPEGIAHFLEHKLFENEEIYNLIQNNMRNQKYILYIEFQYDGNNFNCEIYELKPLEKTFIERIFNINKFELLIYNSKGTCKF